MKRGLLIFWTMVKGLFVCQHYASDLSINRLLERLTDEEDDPENYQHWLCECICTKCGERNIEHKFALMTYLGDPTTRYPMRHEDMK